MGFDNNDSAKSYWRANLTIMASLLTLWFLVSFGCGILLVDQLNTLQLGGFKLGFWFAQQGSICVFVVLIFIYIAIMNQLDKKYNVQEDD
jgi:putative solute:sodium symporter small subunit